MTTILAKSDTIAPTHLANCVEVANRVLAKWGTAWGITANVSTDATIKADMQIFITEKSPHPNAGGYHDVEGIPTAYVTPSHIHQGLYGYYAPAVYSKAITAFGKVIRPAKPRTPARYGAGVVTDFVHEILEMLADGHINRASAPDSTSQNWLVEVCDHVSGWFDIEPVGGFNAVIPNATLPNYYALKSQPPYDLLGHCASPFDTKSPSFYGFTVDAKGALTKIQAGSVRH